MPLHRLIGRFVLRHRAAYGASAVMLVGIALLLVWIPRQIEDPQVGPGQAHAAIIGSGHLPASRKC